MIRDRQTTFWPSGIFPLTFLLPDFLIRFFSNLYTHLGLLFFTLVRIIAYEETLKHNANGFEMTSENNVYPINTCSKCYI